MTLAPSTIDILVEAAYDENEDFVYCTISQLWHLNDQEPRQSYSTRQRANAFRRMYNNDNLMEEVRTRKMDTLLGTEEDGIIHLFPMDLLQWAVRDDVLPVAYFCLQDERKARSVRMAKLLLENNTDLESVDSDGNTPIASCSSLKVVKLLVAVGADVDASNNQGQTVLDRVAARCRSDIMSFLLEHGATEWVVDDMTITFMENLLRRHEQRAPGTHVMNMIKSVFDEKEGSYRRTGIVKGLLKSKQQKGLLLQVLQSPVSIVRKNNIIGPNIRWNLALDPITATDRLTGQKIDLSTTMFAKKAVIRLTESFDKKTRWYGPTVIKACGTVRQVLVCIRKSFRHVLESDRIEERKIWFRGIRWKHAYWELDITDDVTEDPTAITTFRW